MIELLRETIRRLEDLIEVLLQNKVMVNRQSEEWIKFACSALQGVSSKFSRTSEIVSKSVECADEMYKAYLKEDPTSPDYQWIYFNKTLNTDSGGVQQFGFDKKVALLDENQEWQLGWQEDLYNAGPRALNGATRNEWMFSETSALSYYLDGTLLHYGGNVLNLASIGNRNWIHGTVLGSTCFVYHWNERITHVVSVDLENPNPPIIWEVDESITGIHQIFMWEDGYFYSPTNDIRSSWICDFDGNNQRCIEDDFRNESEIIDRTNKISHPAPYKDKYIFANLKEESIDCRKISDNTLIAQLKYGRDIDYDKWYSHGHLMDDLAVFSGGPTEDIDGIYLWNITDNTFTEIVEPFSHQTGSVTVEATPCISPKYTNGKRYVAYQHDSDVIVIQVPEVLLNV